MPVNLSEPSKNLEEWRVGSTESFNPIYPISSYDYVPKAPNPEATWTTARCNRLIRPLSSKISGLRRIKKLGSRELQTLHPDSAGILPAEALLRRRKSDSKRTGQQSRHDGRRAGSTTRIYSFPRNQKSPECNTNSNSSDSDRGRDPWADVLGERRARGRFRKTYLNKICNTDPKLDMQWMKSGKPTFIANTAKPSPTKHFADMLVLSGPGIPDVSHLSQQGDPVHVNENIISDMVDPDIIVVGDFRSGTSRLRSQFRDLVKFIYPVNWKLADGIWENLDALLRPTSPDQALKQDPRSLFGSCLRQIPTYIAQEQLHVSQEDDDDNFDVSTAVYDELEALGTSGKAGWRHLKDVVRAHGIRLIADAVQQSVISLPVARGLVILCLHREAYPEAQTIIQSMLRMMKPLSKPRSITNKLFAFGQSVSLRTMALLHFTNRSDKFAFTYRQLAVLFKGGVLPVEWIACRDLVELWNRAVISIAQGDAESSDAASLLRVIISLVYDKSPEMGGNIDKLRHGAGITDTRDLQCGFARSSSNGSEISRCCSNGDASNGISKTSDLCLKAAKTVTNILTVLSSIAILQKLDCTILQDVGIEAQQVQELIVCSPDHGYNDRVDRDQLGLTLLAYELTREKGGLIDQGPFNEGLISHNIFQSASTEFCAITGAFVRNVARCCSKATGRNCFLYLQDLVVKLNGVSLGRSRKLYESVSLAAAFAFAEETNQHAHLQWALELERSAAGRLAGQTLRTPGRALRKHVQSSKYGYRWEEGICEWVAQTPAGTLSDLKEKGTEQVEADDDNNLDDVNKDDLLSYGLDGIAPSPCLKKRRRESNGSPKAARHDPRDPKYRSFNYRYTAEQSSLKNDLIQKDSASIDKEGLSNGEADELAQSLKPTLSESSEGTYSVPLGLDPARSATTYQQSNRADCRPHLRGVRAVARRGLFQSARKHAKAGGQVEDSEDELSVS